MDPQKYFSIFKNFIESSSLGYGFSDLKGNIVYANPTLCHMLEGDKAADLLETNVADYYPDHDRQRLLDEVLPCVKEKGAWYGELALRSRRGHIIDTTQNITLIRDDDGTPIFLGNILTDITEQRRTARDLRREKEKAEKYLNIVKVMIVGIDVHKNVALVNQRTCEILGYDKKEIVGKNWFDHFIPERMRQDVNAVAEALFHGEFEPVEYHENPVLTRSGEERLIAWHNIVLRDDDGKIEALLSSGEDITERRKEKEDLELTQFSLDHSSVAVFWVNREGQFFYANDQAVKALGYSRDELLQMHVWEIDPLMPQEQWAVHWEEVKQEKVLDFEMVHRRKDGTEFPVEIHANYVSHAGKEYIFSFVRDITERKKYEEDIRSQESFMTNVFSSTQDGISVLDKDMRIIRVNPKMEEWYAHEMPLVGKKCFIAYHGRDKECEICPTCRVLHDRKPAYRVVPKTGPNKEITGWLDLFAFPLLDSNTGEMLGVIEYVRDITERRQAEEDLKKALREKETLLNEVHHRVKNNLLTLYSLVNLQQGALRSQGETGRALEDTKQRISAMGRVHRMLYASKDFAQIDFAEYIRSLSEEIITTYGTEERPIEVDLHLEPIALTIDTAIPCGLIINELLVNAFRHAFVDRPCGRITVSMKGRHEQITLKVQDDGIGMDENHLSENSKTLGLRLVMMLSQQLGGTISFNGEKGSLFTIVFKNVTIKGNGDDDQGGSDGETRFDS